MPRFRFLLRLLLLLVALSSTAWASVTTGAIKGTVIDEGGLPIPGVLVTIKSENMMGIRQQETDDNGRFLFIELPPGTYSLTAEMAGFAKYERPNLDVNIGRNTILTIEMKMATAEEVMVVEEEKPVIDTESANQGSVLTKEFLDRMPVGNSYQQAVQMAAGVTGGSNPNVAGSAYNENTYLLDGINITDPVTGTFSLNFNFDAIEQIEVLTSAFDPEYGVNLGGSVNVVTESGGNNLETLIGAYHQNGDWSPKLDAVYAADGSELAPTDFDSTYRTYRIVAKVSGPIIRDKAWFIASYQQSRTLIANVGIDLPRDFDGHYLLGKLTFQPSTDHRFTILATTDPSTIDNIDQSDRYTRPEAQGRQAQGGFALSLQWDWFISPDAFLETKTLLQKSFIERYQVPCTHNKDLGYNPCEADELENSIDFETPGRFGSYRAYNSNNYVLWDFDDRWRASIGSKFSLLQVDFGGTHDIKIGASYDQLIWDKSFGVTGDMYYVDLNEVSYNPDTYQNYYWVEYTGPFHYVTTAHTYGLFIQDVYKPVDNLTFRYGTRWDRQVFNNDVGETIIDAAMFGPRFSAIWDPWANAKTKLVGSVGRFNDTSRLGVADYMSQSGLGSKLFLGEFFYQYYQQGYESTASNNYSYTPLENTNTVIDGTIVPRADIVSVGVEREVVQDFAATLYFTGKFTRNLYAFDELNLIWDETGYNMLGSGDGELRTYYRLRTPNIARRDYYRTDVGWKRAWADRWTTQGTYSYTISRGSVQTAPSAFLAVPPQVEYYVNGYLGTDIRHDVSAGFAWEIPDDPWTTQLGGTFFFESGYPISRYYSNAFQGGGSYLKQTVGTYARTESWWDLNILVRQDIPVRKGNLAAELQVYNITNNRKGEYATISSDNRWTIYNRQSPISVQIGAEYEF